MKKFILFTLLTAALQAHAFEAAGGGDVGNAGGQRQPLEMETAIQQQYHIPLEYRVETTESAPVVFGGPDAFIRQYTRFDEQKDQCLQRTAKNIAGESNVEIQIDMSNCTHLKNSLNLFQGRNFEPKRLNLTDAQLPSATLFVQTRRTGERICAVKWESFSHAMRIRVVYSVDEKFCK